MRSKSPTERGEKRRVAILAAAKSVFVEHGYAEANLDEVISRSGGSRATLYQYFGGKEGLFAAVISEISEQIVAPLASPGGTETEVLLAFGRAYMAALMSPEGLALYRVLIGEGARFPQLAEAVYRAGPAVTSDELAAHLTQWDAEERLRVRDPALAARQFLEMVKGDLHFRALLRLDPMPTAFDVERCVAEAVQLFIKGQLRT